MATTTVISPDGSIGDVPNERVGDALRAGGQLGMDVTDPHGNAGVVPMSRVHDAIHAGATLTPPAYAPKVSTNVPEEDGILGAAFKMADNSPFTPGLMSKTVGVAKGIGSTLDNADKLYRASQGDVTGLMQDTPSLLTPSNDYEGLGKLGEQGAEYLAGPGAMDAAASKVSTSTLPKMLIRAVAGGASNATVSALHGDDTPAQLATSAGLGAAGPVVEGIGSAVGNKLAPWLVSRAVPTLTRDTAMGKDAAQGIVDNGLVAATRGSLRAKVLGSLDTATSQLNDTIQQASVYGGKTVDVRPAMKRLDDAIASAAGDQSLYDALNTLKDKATNIYAPNPYDGGKTFMQVGTRNLASLTPADAQSLKGEIAKTVTNWGTAGGINPVSAAKRGLRSGIDDAITSAVPETAGINANISNLMAAKRSLQRPSNMTLANTARDVLYGGPVVAGLHAMGLNVPAAVVGAGVAGSRLVPVATTAAQGFRALGRNAGTLYNVGRSVEQAETDVDNGQDATTTTSPLNNTMFNMQLLQNAARRNNSTPAMLQKAIMK